NYSVIKTTAMKRILLLITIVFIFSAPQKIFSQGCVAIKGTAGICSRPSDAKGWELNISNRYFRSYKHFIGKVEQKQRVQEGSEVINHSYEMDITATRTLNSRWSLAMVLPVMDFSR